MKKILLLLFVCGACCFTDAVRAQQWAVKSNLLYDATTTLNLGVEVGLSEKWSVDLSGNWNPWTFSENKKWKHWLVQPEVRYWTCKRLGGHFLAGHLLGGVYNVGNIDGLPDFLGTKFSTLADNRYAGWFVGAGVGYGYAWMLGEHWNLEAEIGLGYAYSDYDSYLCPRCGSMLGSGDHHYFGITKASISLVFVF